jgi:hypothetical protein
LLKRHDRIYHNQDITQAESIPLENARHQFFGARTALCAVQLPTLSSTETISDGTVSFPGPSPNSVAPRHDGPALSVRQPHLSTDIFPQQSNHELHGAPIWTPALDYHSFSLAYARDEFSNFVDSIGFPSNPFDPSYQPIPDWPSESTYNSHADLSHQQQLLAEAPNIGVDELDPETTLWASRMPSVQPQEQHPDQLTTRRHFVSNDVAQVTHTYREVMIEKLKAYPNIIAPDFKLPSRHTLTCFATGYVTIFNEHYPLLHLPTLKLETLSLELFLSIAALGAQYYWERAKGLELFHVARAITYERLRGQAPSSQEINLADHEVLQAAQALILLIAVSTWSEAGKGEAFSLRSLLEDVMHAECFNLNSPAHEESWPHWKHYEEVKRMKLIAYCFFNLHTITFDVPPMMLYRDLDVELACSERLWRADTAEKWRLQLMTERPSIRFAGAFQALFDTSTGRTNDFETRSPLSGHTLLQAIIQHIWLLQQAENLPVKHTIASTEAANSVEFALKRWRTTWETKDESSSAPHTDGPMPFTSRALLRLAYIRINIDSGSCRAIGTWDPQKIAKSLFQHSPVQRNDKMTRAALHCAQGLGIPIKLGINFVAHTQVFYWSNQYTLCSLECALLLTKWLESVVVPDQVPALTVKERNLLDFVVQLVNHTEYEAPRTQLLRDNKTLSVIILRLWAKLFRPDSVWEIVDLIGRSLRAYADFLEEGDNQAV